ncbi:anti-sigma factor antagonist [Spirillospora albida]|uniref:anti-sigma factor antagonist n=1 Tax=Spirillospora albida TaxID=58123 RepID=UPI00068CE63D|nr:anti-sigma factor antagonist [Spirillospora albida]
MSVCTVTGRAEGPAAVITLSGDLSLPCVQEVERKIRDVRREHGEHLVFDLAPLTFLDSSGLSLLLRFYLAAEGRGGGAALVGPLSGQVSRVLQITNLDQRLTIHDSLDAALDALRDGGPGPGTPARPGPAAPRPR